MSATHPIPEYRLTPIAALRYRNASVNFHLSHVSVTWMYQVISVSHQYLQSKKTVLP